MFIRVEYKNSKYDYIEKSQFDNLLESNQISKFLRSSGWVTVGIDPIRKKRIDPAFDGPEKRNRFQNEPV